jgi:hypothetical protein
MSIYDIARQLKLSGVVVQAHIDPTRITPRIKKMTQAMLRKGVLKGGWNSKSLQLAQTLMRDSNLPVLHHWNAVFRTRQLSPSELAQFDEWFEADVMIEKLKIANPQEKQWAINRLNENVEENKAAIRKLSSNMGTFYLRFDNPEYRAQASELLLSLRLPEDVAALNALADRLDDPTPIPLTINI